MQCLRDLFLYGKKVAIGLDFAEQAQDCLMLVMNTCEVDKNLFG